MSDGPRIGAALGATVPAATVLAAVVVDLVSWSAGTTLPPAPWLVLAAVAFWSLERPDLLPPSVVVAIGVSADLVGGVPPGLSALILVAASLVLVAGRSEIRAQAALAGWLAVALVLLAGVAARWLAMSLWSGQLLPPLPALLDALLTVALYPLVAAALATFRPLLPRLARAVA